ELVRIWARWHKETWADLCGLLLGGPSVVATQMDVVGRSPASALQFNPADVHPTPYLRVLISLDLLRRMGFAKEAEGFRRSWMHIYPNPTAGTIPDAMRPKFPQDRPLGVET